MRRQKREPRELSPYQKKLLDPRWQKKRLEILERDKWECFWCGDKTSTLHVHHLYYMQEQEPWDYPVDALVTLCAECHEEETNYRRVEEENLLFALRKRRVFHTQIRDLANAFLYLNHPGLEDFPKGEIPVIQSIAWALQNTDVMVDILNLWGEAMRQKYPDAFNSRNGNKE